MFMDLDSILIQKQGKKAICQFLAFWTFQWLELIKSVLDPSDMDLQCIRPGIVSKVSMAGSD